MSDMATVIAYRNDGSSPFCELRLANDDRILISLDAAGALIERLPGPGAVRETLFRGSPEEVAWICAAIAGAGGSTAVLDVIVNLAARLGSAEQIRSAFAAASGTLSRLRERAG
jgi:hypothetical protein